MGKSQVALEYAHRMLGVGRYQVTGWVRADSAVTAAEDLAALAPMLGLGADGPAGEVAAAVVAVLGHGGTGWSCSTMPRGRVTWRGCCPAGAGTC